MKTKLITLLALSWTMFASAQTADSFITAGTNALAHNNWWGADTNFTAALGASNGSTNETANALKAMTRLLVLPQTPAGSNFLVTLGFPKTNRYMRGAPIAGLPKDADGNTVLPANYNSTSLVAFFRTNIMGVITNSATNLANIKAPAFTLMLSSNETGIEAVTLDYGDIQMLRAMLSALQFQGFTLNANNFGVVIPQLMTNGLNLQWMLSTYPNLLTLQNPGDLASSKIALTNAIALYFGASDFIHNTRPHNATDNLFLLSTNDYPQELEFREVLTNVLLSLNTPTEMRTGDGETNIAHTLYLGAYFAGTHSLRSLMPQFYGNIYVNNSLPDYTFGGVLPYQPACETEMMLRKEFHSYAGLYAGQVADLTYNDPEAGIFGVLVGTNGQATVVGYDVDSYQNINATQSGGVAAKFNVDEGGHWEFNSNSLAGVSGYGSIGRDGSFWGELDFTNGDSVQLFGNQQSPLGPFQSAAGGYNGTWSITAQGQHFTGNLWAGLSADGYLPFCVFDPSGAQNDGGMGLFGLDNKFITTNATSGNIITGTLNPLTLQITGTITNGPFDGPFGGTFTLNRNAKVPFDVPPVITSNLPPSITIPLGTNVTFFLVVTGSPPLCYQWYYNGTEIPGAISNKLTVSNNLWTSTGTYSISAAVDNVVGETNSQEVAVHVTAETVPPSVSITAPTPGQLWSNAVFAVTGTASDNAAVSNVFCSVSNSAGSGPWILASTANNWANWTTNVTLAAGTNMVRAYAVDTSGNRSTTNSANVIYVVSAPLTVKTNGVGSISPNLNGVPLQIGATYSLTATAGAGYAFTNWTGGTSLPLAVLTNGATLQFMMQSNLVLQANFVDTNKPVVAITNITTGMLVSNALFNVMGWATDNVAVANVYCSLSNSAVNTGYALATTANNWANWSTNMLLMPGTNTIRAYAVDSSGNISPTNSVNLVYILSATLTVKTNGVGSISPNLNGASLQINSPYLLTATAGTGYAFTNWTGGTNGTLAVLTNGVALQFLMQSNLVLQANFVDTNKPVLAITNLTSGMNVSNALFNVMGTATDNVAVASVYCSLSNSVVNTGYALATTANNWANWSTNMTLIPGTNTIRAYAMDTSGNVSATNSVNFAYVVSAPLTVQTNGLGSISPNLNGVPLQIGTTYLLTATAGRGFAFTNWTGGTNGTLAVLTNGVALQFMMQSNLVLQANFVDTNKPVVTITNITAGMLVSNALFNVMGTATDNVAVASVYCSLSNSAFNTGYALATTANNWANWSTNMTLTQGTNTVRVYAVDASGNISPTNSLNLVYILSATLTVKTNGVGSINPNLNGASLQIGSAYLLTATVGTGSTFTNWTGGTNGTLAVLTNGVALQFMMQSNLVLQANFIDTQKPTMSITNVTAGMLVSNAAFTVKGTASDNLAVSNVLYSLNGSASASAVLSNGGANWSALVALSPGTNTFAAYAVDTTGNISTTNSVNFVYVLSATLTVKTNGGGTITPNLNGQSLAIGTTFLVTATTNVGAGFIFSNWTGGTSLPLAVLTNGPALQFAMQSNLVLQANFMDVQKPVLAITSPTNLMIVSNSVFTATGTATDNVAVASVSYSLNSSAFAPASTGNGWASWTAALNLIAGTNTLAAYAVDTSGYVSATNSVIFKAVLSTPLTVHTNGSGIISPNYDGVSLQIGNTYSMTATAGAGFAFTNWTGSLTTNGATLTFTMASNLTFTANFTDIQPPVVAITNVTAGMQVNNALFTVMGTSGDNVGVTNVNYSLNSGAWTNAATANNWANWSKALTLTAGTNTIAAYAVDATGNKSVTNSATVVLAFQITTASLPMGTNGFPYNLALGVLGGQSPYTWTNTTGTLPAGMNLSPNGVMSGTPTVTATNNLTVQVTDNLGSMASKLLTLVITSAPPLRVTTTSLPNGTNGVFYSQVLAATGGHPPYGWTKTTGTLPPGLGVAAGGVISGFPTTNGTSTFTVRVTDSVSASSLKSLTLVINTNTGTIRPVLNSAGFLPGNKFGFQLYGAAGQNYTLQMSTNLASTNWVPIWVTNGPGGIMSLTDPDATNLGRFYRIMLGP